MINFTNKDLNYVDTVKPENYHILKIHNFGFIQSLTRVNSTLDLSSRNCTVAINLKKLLKICRYIL